MRHLNWSRITFIGIFGWMAAAYFSCLPHSVQTGDTGEMVTAAFRGLVPHPPGFPLYIWLQSAFLKICPFGTIFWRAAFFNALISLTTLFLLALALGEISFWGAGLAGMLGFSGIFWRYAELPDVFALNAFFAALVLLLYQRGPRRILPLIFGLGLAVHPTLLFLFPLVLHSVWEERKSRSAWLWLLSGVFVSFILYLSLVCLNPGDFSSWGQVASVDGWVAHILRRDYGTFQLSPGHDQGSLLANLSRLGTKTLTALFALVAGVMMTERGQRAPLRARMIVLCAVLYGLVFFALANTPLEGFRGEIFDRFVILFLILIAFALALRLLANLESLPRPWRIFTAALILTSVPVSFFLYGPLNDFSRNTIVEDYALNLLREIPQGVPTIVLVDSDTRYFALRYAQLVLGVKPEAVLISPATLIYPWYADKVRHRSGLKFNHDRVGPVGLQEELIAPNLERFEVLTNLPFTPQPAYQLSVAPLGRMLSQPGMTTRLDPTIQMILRSSESVLYSDPLVYDPYRDLLSDYAWGPVLRTSLEKASARSEHTTQRLREALAIAPWCWRAQAELCSSEPSPECNAKVEALRTHYFNYF